MTEIRVVKLGGSLLEWSETPERLARWMNAQPPARTVVIVGGGELVESLRKLNRTWHLAERATHFLAIDLMSVTAKLLKAEFPEWPLFADRQLERAVIQSPVTILDVANWAKSNSSLREDWSVSSDSIAAAVAMEIQADELVLLKSSLPASADSFAAIVDSDYVDEAFREWGFVQKRVRFVDLRSADFCEMQFAPTASV